MVKNEEINAIHCSSKKHNQLFDYPPDKSACVGRMPDRLEYCRLFDLNYYHDSDGLPDEFEGTITIFNGKTLYSDPLLADTDVDGLYDGQEITCRIEPGAEPNEVYVFVWLHSDPNGDDSDGDGIPDGEDTAPLTKGYAGGIVGELSIVSYFKDSDPFYKGHSFLVYKSYINDILDIHGLTDGYYGTEISCGTVPLYEIDRNNYISFGAWMESIEYDFSNSIPESCITSIPARQNGGIYYNYEAYGMRENHACYLPNAALKQFISFDQLTSLLQFLNTQNWYSVTNHNCATVASKACFSFQ